MALPKKQHEGYAKFFEEPTRESLRELLKYNIGELDYLDFKEVWPDTPKLAKHILGLANSGGGALVIGTKQNDDGSIEPVGLIALADKTDITNKIKDFLPDQISAEILDFSYKESEYLTLKGKSFQVMLVESDPKSLPFLAKKDGDGVKRNAVYVREGVSTTEASHETLQKIINRRLDTGYSSQKVLALKEHLEQLKIPDKERPGNNSGLALLFGEEALGNIFATKSTSDYKQFVESLYHKKKKLIVQDLGL
jgi:predicted HTH transcriptional regulator